MLSIRINDDFIAAFKAKDTFRKDLLNTLKSAIKYAAIDKGEDLSDEEVIDVISKESKKRKDSISQFTAADRMDLVDVEQKELDILATYLPEQFSEEEIGTIIDTVLADLGTSARADMGKIMGAVMPSVKGKADGALVKQVLESKLS